MADLSTRSTFDVRVVFHSEAHRVAFLDALTGNDTDVLLAMENALNVALDIDDFNPEIPRIWLEPVE